MGKAKRNREARRSVATEVSTSRRHDGTTERTVVTSSGVEMSEGLARLAGLTPDGEADN